VSNHVVLPPSLNHPRPPTRAEFQAALDTQQDATGQLPCDGQPAGTPCSTWQNPDGSVTICRCDGNGECQYPGA
jgi:hypothetical protein